MDFEYSGEPTTRAYKQGYSKLRKILNDSILLRRVPCKPSRSSVMLNMSLFHDRGGHNCVFYWYIRVIVVFVREHHSVLSVRKTLQLFLYVFFCNAPAVSFVINTVVFLLFIFSSDPSFIGDYGTIKHWYPMKFYGNKSNHNFNGIVDLKPGHAQITNQIEGILPKGPYYPPCLRMADRTLLAGYPRYVIVLIYPCTKPNTPWTKPWQ